MPEASPRSRLVFAVLLAVAFWASPSEATNSPIELKTVLARLTDWLPGQFDSEPQRFFEVEMKIAAEKVHGRVYRSFVRIEAPEVGETVFVATVRYGGKEGQFDPGEFQVWTLSVDLERAAVRMSPRRFADPAKFRDGARSAATFKGLKAADLLPAAGAAGCDVFWRLNGKQLLGRTASGGCSAMSTTLKSVLHWEWEWLLNDEELWLTFAGRDASGKLVNGREDQVHWRLGKARDYECFVSYKPETGEAQVNNGFHLHDRGDVYRWKYTEGAQTTDIFLVLTRGMWPSNSGRNYVDLLRLESYAGRPEDPKEKQVFLGGGHASATSDRAAFSGPKLSGRCKLFDPAAPPPSN